MKGHLYILTNIKEIEKKREKQSSLKINHTSPCTRAKQTKRSRRHVSNVALKSSIWMWNDVACTT